MTNVITNPVVIALVAGLLTYLYFMWSAPIVRKRLKKGERKETIKLKPSMTIPLIVTVVTWIVVYCYQEYYSHKTGGMSKVQSDTKYTLKKGSDSQNRSYRMMTPGVGIPTPANGDFLPDVFINTIG